MLLWPAPGAENVPTVHSDGLPIEILVRGGKEHGVGHVPVRAGPAGGDLVGVLFAWDVRLLLVVAVVGGHLAGEDSRGDAVDADLQAVLGDLVGEHAGQVDGGGLGGVVGEVVLGRLDDAADGADVDDGAGEVVVVLVRRLQQREEGRRHEEELRHVGAVRVGPHLERLVLVVEQVLGHLLGARDLGLLGIERDPRVVDQDAQALLAPGHVLDELLDLVLLRHVRRDGDDGPGNVLAVDFRHPLQLLLRPPADVHFGSVGGKRLCRHQSDPCAPARDQGDFALDIEELGKLEFFIVLVDRRHG